MINTIGPVWDGNEVWLLVAGGATFAAFPEWYATLFSGFYLPLLLILLALIVRGVAFEYRAKGARRPVARPLGPRHHHRLVRPVAAVGRGVRQHPARRPDRRRTRSTPAGSSTCSTPTRCSAALTTLLLFLTHGAIYISLKTDGPIRERARALAVELGLGGRGRRGRRSCSGPRSMTGNVGSAVFFVLAAARAASPVSSRSSQAARAGPSSARSPRSRSAVAGLFLALFPDVMPSSPGRRRQPDDDQRRRRPTTRCTVMTVVAVIFTPVVLVYQAWTYWVFRKRIAVHHIPATTGASRHPPDETDRPPAGPAPGPGRGARWSVVVSGGVVASLLVIGQAWLVTGLVVAVVDGHARPALGAGGRRRLRGAGLVGLLHRASARARAAGVVGTDVRREVLRAVLVAAPPTRPRPGETAVLVTRGVTRRRALPDPLPPGPGAGRGAAAADRRRDRHPGRHSAPSSCWPPCRWSPSSVRWSAWPRATGPSEQWRAMSSLSGHFLDVMRGLPTLVAFRRARAQSSPDPRRSPTATAGPAWRPCGSPSPPRPSSSSSPPSRSRWSRSPSASASAAGDLDLHTALVVLLLAPEAYWPLRRVGAEFHAAAEGVATFERVDALLAREPDRRRPTRPRAAAGRPGGRRRHRHLPGPGRCRPSTPRRAGHPGHRHHRRHRPVGLRQVDAARRCSPGCCAPDERPRARRRRAGRRRGLARQVALAPAAAALRRRHDRRQRAPRRAATPTTPRSGRRCAGSLSRSGSAQLPRASTPRSARTAPRSRPASGPASPWPGSCSPTAPGCCSTSPPPTSTR